MMHGYFNSSSTNILQACSIIRKLKTGTRGLNVSFQLERLDSRGLIRVKGADVASFMQGIVTNDMKHLQDCPSLFTMFLNTKGRVLYDAIIYKQKEDNVLFVECDRQCLDDLMKHLKMYRVRRKIDVDSIDDEKKLWVGFHPDIEFKNKSGGSARQEQIVPCSSPTLDSSKSYSYLDDIILGDNIMAHSDPRIPVLGKRIIAPANEDLSSYLKGAGVNLVTSAVSYRMFRYRLGVGEGIEELPIGKCFPLEANCDYLHGVSFHKGCYIGQELTARTHHTGVVRKRLMPLLLQSEVTAGQVSNDLPIEDTLGEQKRPVGKLRGVEKNSGLGLMRIAEALNARRLKVGDVEGETTRPFWWPQEITKERSDTGTK